ncbi:MAG: carboxymuconolactone decarboxylase family protein [Candidatus Lindowbacteria bacterium]|nr:carboxymuconolactone decarboxylase family protein [Candidatus Lindowbacteria bacterium]
MTRIPYANIEASSPKTRDFFQKIKNGGFEILNVHRMVAHSEASVREFVRLGSRLIMDAHLEHRFRELAILRIAQICGANYEWAHHVPIAMQSGVALEQIKALRNWRESSLFTEQEKTVLKFTEEVVKENQPKEETFAAASAFLDHPSLVELMLSIGFWAMVARFLITFRVDVEESFQRENGALLKAVEGV